MATAEWETYALSGRFKTKRRKKQLVRKYRDKQLIHLHKEIERIRVQQHNLGYRELLPPVQKGWKRFFVLRPDVAAGKDAAFFLALLEKINTTEYSHRKDFKYKRRRNGKRVDIERIQKLKEFHLDAFHELHLSEREKNYFNLEWRFFPVNRLLLMYVFTEPWRYVLRVRPNMITHQKIIDPQLMSRKREIEGFLDRSRLYPRLHRLRHGNYYGNWHMGEKEKYKQVRRMNPLDEIETND